MTEHTYYTCFICDEKCASAESGWPSASLIPHGSTEYHFSTNMMMGGELMSDTPRPVDLCDKHLAEVLQKLLDKLKSRRRKRPKGGR